MEINMQLVVSDEVRKAINSRQGKPGLADRKGCITHIEAVLNADFETIADEMERQSDYEPQGEQF